MWTGGTQRTFPKTYEPGTQSSARLSFCADFKYYAAMKKLVILILIFIAGSAAWKFWPEENLQWQAYENKVYGYSLLYPSLLTNPSSNNEYSGSDLSDEGNINFGVPGKTNLFTIDVDYFGPEVEKNIVKDGPQVVEMMQAKKELFSQPLKTYAENVRTRQTVPDPYLRPEVGEMKEIMLAGKTAYTFSLTDGFTHSTGGYTLGDGQTYNYVITENSAGQKIVIHYLIGSTTYSEGIKTARKMLESFNFTNN
jgi:hypothetical protein